MTTIIVWVLALFPGGDWAAGDKVPEVTGIVGGSLTVPCTYSSFFIGYSQYWCRGAHWYYCSIVVQSTGSEEEVRAGRFSLKDCHAALTFTVTMTGLSLEDSGLYWCGTERYGIDEMFQVLVTVSSADPNFTQSLKSSSIVKGASATSSSLGTTALSPRWTDHDEISTVPGLSGTTAEVPRDFAHSLDSTAHLWSWVPAALLGILFLAAVSALIVFMNRNIHSEKDVQMDASISLSTLPPEDILKNTVYALVEPAGAEQILLSSMIDGFPVSAFPDPCYEDIQCLCSEASTFTNPTVSWRRIPEVRTGYDDEEYTTVIATGDRGDMLYENVYDPQVILLNEYGSSV